MLGKSTLENYPGLMEPAQHPLEQVHMDMYSSSVNSIEGYNHALILPDSHGELRWQYGMKTKDETLAMSKRWFAEIADFRAKFPLSMVAIVEKELNEFFT
jgi:hypothetical protein